MADFLNSPLANLNDVPRFEVTSTDFVDGQEVPPAQRSGRMEIPGGEDVSPQLSWRGFPAGTRSFVVTMYDPDAPTGSGWWHWSVANVPADVTDLPTGAGDPDGDAMPAGSLTVRNDAGFAGYLGAAPPAGHGLHRYFVIVHALDVPELEIEADASPAMVTFNAFFHCIGRAWMECTFGLPQ